MDLFYFDTDMSWDAEDRVIRMANERFPSSPPVETRNQARVHLWYEKHFGRPIAPLIDCEDSIRGFAARTHAVGVRLAQNDDIQICAPFGLDDIFAMRLVPNLRNLNRETHATKSKRCKDLWPEINFIPWPSFDTIQQAGRDEDWSSILALLHRAFGYMDGRIDPPSSLHRLNASALAVKAQDEICLLARDGDRIVGCIFCKPEVDHLYVGKLAVEPDRQGSGIGRFLMQAAEDRARWLELPAMILDTRIELTENRAAFETMGFQKVAKTSHAGYDRPTSIKMRKSL